MILKYSRPPTRRTMIMLLGHFFRFVMIILWVGIIACFVFRTKLYGELHRIMEKYPREFDKLGVDKKLLYVPEFCNFTKIKKKIDMSNEEIASLIKRLNISKYSLWGSFALFFLFGFLIVLISKAIK